MRSFSHLQSQSARRPGMGVLFPNSVFQQSHRRISRLAPARLASILCVSSLTLLHFALFCIRRNWMPTV
ncbi:hypothetical protein Y032_0010g852 [Ancylostoma ceylanicum]|uniref:Uncharacterized protein n=1 Tax=Ancylostoma ceylanicum TaxID=53326 RepID=A0A016VHX5_9BILA|nr:hypothetical protein Y032_0010g852 [Ancylostoma ceylanicum]